MTGPLPRIAVRRFAAFFIAMAIVVAGPEAKADTREIFDALPLAAQATVAEALARGDQAFHARETSPGIIELRNAEHDLRAEVTEYGVTMWNGEVRWQLSLRRWGRGADLVETAKGRVAPSRNRVDVHRAALVEWYMNGPLGIEQGFTLPAAPSAADGRPVVLELQSGGRAHLDVASDRASLEVIAPTGERRLRYAGLTAIDADGHELPATMTGVGDVLRIEVDDRGARYPIVVDPLVQTAKWRPVKRRSFLLYGASVAMSGDTLVVGVPEEPVPNPAEPFGESYGALHVFVRSGATWSSVREVAILRATLGIFNLGYSVAIDGDTIVSGSPETSLNGPDGLGVGAALVYVRPPGGWTDMAPTAALTASDGDPGFGSFDQDFANAVAIDGGTIVIGAKLFDGQNGAAYVYEKPLGGWANATENAKLTAAIPILNERLGQSVGVSGDVVVVGAPAYPANAGSALIYERPIGGWVSMTETAAIGASDGQTGDAFGAAVAIDGDTIAIGAGERDAGIVENVGGIYVFEKPLGGWMSETETALLLPASLGEGAFVGDSVAILGSRIAAGAPALSLEYETQGGVYLFDEPPGGWVPVTETALLSAGDPEGLGQFGRAVALSADGSIAASAPVTQSYPYEVVGTAYVFQDLADAVECPAAPTLGCVPAGKGKLALKYSTAKPGGNQLQWKFDKGPELHRADFGDPVANTSYALCVYGDGALAIARPLLGGFGRWTLSGSDAFAYANKDKFYAIGGIRKGQLKGGVPGKSAIQIKAKGADVGSLPKSQVAFVMLDATTSVQVQLVQGGGGCYETTFLPANVSENEYGYVGATFELKGSFKAGY